MAVEEIGVKLVTEGEKAVQKAFDSCEQALKSLEKATDNYVGSAKDQESATVNVEKAIRGARSTIAGMDKDIIIAGKNIGSMADGLSALGINIPATPMAAFGQALKAVIDYSKQAIKDASDLNETISKSKVVFGEANIIIEQMGETAATALGMSKQEAIGAAATYGNLLTSMGLTSGKAAEMSVSMVQLAADLASFNNVPMAEALEKIRAGLVGEAEPLKALGININEALLKQEALSLGLISGNEALDAAAKAQAAYSLMLKQSSNAQGDFARTADGAANQQRILEAQLKNVSAAIGQELIPAYIEALRVQNAFMVGLYDVITASKRMDEKQDDLKKSLMESNVPYDQAVKLMYLYKGQMIDNADAVTKFTHAGDRAKATVFELFGSVNVDTMKIWGKEITGLGEAEWDAAIATGAFSTEVKEASVSAAAYIRAIASVDSGMRRLPDAIENAKDRFAEMAQAQIDAANAAVENKAIQTAFANALNGPVGKAYDDHLQKTKNITDQITEYKTEIGKLSKLRMLTPAQETQLSTLYTKLDMAHKKVGEFAKMSPAEITKVIKAINGEIWNLTQGAYLTPDQKKQLDELKGKLGEAEGSLKTLEEEFEKANKKMVFTMLLKSLQESGLTGDALKNATLMLYDMAGATGMLSQKDADLGKAIAAIDWKNLTPAQAQAKIDELYGIASGAKDVADSIAKLHRPGEVQLLKGVTNLYVAGGISYPSFKAYKDGVDGVAGSMAGMSNKKTVYFDVVGKPYIEGGMAYTSFEAYRAAIDGVAGAMKGMSSKTITMTTVYESVYKDRRIGGDQTEARASGGSVQAGQPYLVGERGPELIVPDLSGMVMPNHMVSSLLNMMRAPSAVYNTTTINYNLGVTTMNSPQAVQRSFAMMQLLAG